MKRIALIVAVLILSTATVIVAADAVTPTLTDVYKAITDLRADVAQLKADGFTKTNASGQLATAKTSDGLIVIDVTSIMAGPDATVIALKVTNKTTDKSIKVNTFMSTTLAAGGKEVKIITAEGFSTVLPATTKSGLLLAEPLPKGVKEVVLRTALYDEKTYSNVLEPTLTVPVK